MTDTTLFSCRIGTTSADTPLGLEVWVDRNQILDLTPVAGTVVFQKSLTDLEEGPHELRFVLKNKLPEHTEVTEAGEIVKDATVTVTDIAFDEIELGQLVVDHAVYEHDYNGTQAVSKHKFYGEMGCNGTVTLPFTTPIYIWLLENM